MYCIVRCHDAVTTATVAGDDPDTAVVKPRRQTWNPSDVVDGRLDKLLDVLNTDHFSTLSHLDTSNDEVLDLLTCLEAS